MQILKFKHLSTMPHITRFNSIAQFEMYGNAGYSRGRGQFARGSFRNQSHRGGRGGGFKGQAEPDPPAHVDCVGEFVHACEDRLIYRFSVAGSVPRFNAYVYTESKTKVGKIDEVLGGSQNLMFSVIPEVGIQPRSVKKGAPIFLSPTQLTPLSRFDQTSSSRGGRGRGMGGRGRANFTNRGVRGRGFGSSRGGGRSFGRR